MKDQTVEGIIVRVTEKQWVLLCDDGTFKNVPAKVHEVPVLGERILYEYPPKRLSLHTRYASVLAVSALLLLSMAVFMIFWKHNDPALVVAIDINPSVEVYADEHLRTVKVVPLNGDGEKLVDSINAIGLDVYDATGEIITAALSHGYLKKGEEGLVNATVIPMEKDAVPVSDSELKRAIENRLRENKVKVTTEIFHGSKEQYDESKEMGLSINKYRLYQKLEEKGVVDEPNQIQQRSMNELQKMIRNSEEKTSPQLKENPVPSKNRQTETEHNQNRPAEKEPEQNRHPEKKPEQNRPPEKAPDQNRSEKGDNKNGPDNTKETSFPKGNNQEKGDPPSSRAPGGGTDGNGEKGKAPPESIREKQPDSSGEGQSDVSKDKNRKSGDYQEHGSSKGNRSE